MQQDTRIQDHIVIDSLKDLLRLFRVNLNDDSTFQFNGQSYYLEIDNGNAFDIPLNKPRVDFQIEPSHLHPTNQIYQAHRGTFGNMIERVQAVSQPTSAVPLHQMSNGLVNLDNLLLSSPASSEHHYKHQRIPNFGLSISRTQSETVDYQIRFDKEVQVELGEGQSLNSIQSNIDAKIPSADPIIKVIDCEDAPKQEQTQPPVDDYFARMALLCQLDIEKEEEAAKAEKKLKQKSISTNYLSKNSLKDIEITSRTFNPETQKHTLARKDNPGAQSGQFSNFEIKAGLIPQPALRRYQSFDEHSKIIKNNMNAILDQVQSENQKLKEENMRVKEQLSNVYIGGGQKSISEAYLHLVFLFATPLVVRQCFGKTDEFNKDHFKAQDLLEYKKEYKEIKRSLKETGRHLKVCSRQATIDNLTKILAQNPLALHFSGHGFEKKYNGIESNSLLLEHENGEGEELSEQQLTEIVRASNADLEFVFVASCYSEFAGKVFLKAGARHVICVKSGNQIADEAVILFSKSFYHSVFNQKMTICDSFSMAKQQCEVRYGPKEAAKFTILQRKENFGQHEVQQPRKPKKITKKWAGMPEIDDDEEFRIDLPEPVHSCKVFGPFQKGELEIQDVEVKFKEVPSPVQNFIGRQVEIFEVVYRVLRNRLVTIIGFPGIGKTALAKNAVNYISERKLFKQGVIFFSLKGYKNCNVFLKKLVTNIMVSNFELEQDEQQHIIEGNIEKLQNIIISYFKTMEEQLLVVFDNAEELLYHDKKHFSELITELLSQCPCLTFLMTSRMTVGPLQDIKEDIIVLNQLQPKYAADLFLSRSRLIDVEEKRELLAFKPDNYMLVEDSSDLNTEITNFSKHHLFKLLAGNPHAIILAAPLLLNQRLKDLYQLLNSDKLLEVLRVDGVTDSTVASLCRSLEASIIVLQDTDLLALSFFFMIGLLPGGIFKDELTLIWKQDPSEQHIDKLLKLSLLQMKEQTGDKKLQKLMLPPFINNYAEQTIEPDLKMKFQKMLCEYYVKILKDLFRQDFRQWCANNCTEDTDSKDATPKRQQQEIDFVQELRKTLIRHETNIWACIYRMAKSDKPIQIDQLELEKSLEVPTHKVRRYSVRSPRDNIKSIFKVQKAVRKQSTQIAGPEERLQLTKSESSDGSSKAQDWDIIKTPKLKGQFMAYSVIEEETLNNDDNISDHSSNDRQKFKQRIFNSDGRNNTVSNKKEKEDDDSMVTSEEEGIDEDDKPDFNPYETSQLENSVQPQEEQKSQPSALERMKNSIKNKIVDQLSSIIRNSIVNFSRTSTLRHSITNMKGTDKHESAVSSDTEDDLYLQKKYASQADMLVPCFLGPTASDSLPKGILTLSESEKLIIYYGMNLYLLRDDDSVQQLISKYATEIKGSTLYEANIQRIVGLAHLRKVEINEAMKAFKKAENLYMQCNCQYGIALSRFSIGFMYRSNFSELLNKDSVKEPMLIAKKYFEDALWQFNHLRHIVGQARCHEHLSIIEKKLGHEDKYADHQRQCCTLNTQFSKYQTKYRKSCPHIQRIYGQDLSLMSEIVIDNQARDLFPDLMTITPTGSTRIAKRELSAQYISNFNIEEKSKLTLTHQVSAPPLSLKTLLSQTFSDQQKASTSPNDTVRASSDQLQSMNASTEDPQFFGTDVMSKEESKSNESPHGRVSNSSPMKQNIIQSISASLMSLSQTLSNSSAAKLLNTQPLEIVQEEDDAHQEIDASPIDDAQMASPILTSSNVQLMPDYHQQNAQVCKSPIFIKRVIGGGKHAKVIKSTKAKFASVMSKSLDLTPSQAEVYSISESRSPMAFIESGLDIGKALFRRLQNSNPRKNSTE